MLLSIHSFFTQLKITLCQDVSGTISHDTIYLNIKRGVDITNLVPTVTFTGASINPTSKSSQNFTNPILYTVTAQNGNKKTYRTQIRFLSNSKEITSFIFKKEQNSTLDSNITGTIAGDSILINVPPGVNLADHWFQQLPIRAFLFHPLI